MKKFQREITRKDKEPKAEAHFVKAVKVGEAALARGEYLTHEEVGARLKKMSRP